ncbi:nuclear envelope pore membrane protein POM 121C isoform X2 [Ambystoma mexicanum]|uniref:nuclear envelope pore membrane protein POM 121C isoform X2 n=1 Tax=Ambystoma mexicanum TaxID=8296 RepID=UPI0037E846AE
MVPATGRHSATFVLVRRRARAFTLAAVLLLVVGLLLPIWALVLLLLLAGGAWCLYVGHPGLCLPLEAPLKSCVNGGPSPSPRALLMGSFLGHTQTTAFDGARGHQHRLREALHRPNPTVPSPQKRLSYGEPANMSRFALTPRRRYPIQQTQYALLGAMPTVRWDGYQRKNVLTAKNSSVVHSPVTVKIAPPDSRIARSPVFEKLPSPVLASDVNIVPDPCARETVLNALKASRKRVVDEDYTHLDGQENKRRRHDSSSSGQSAFESLLANGSPASLIPKPGILKRTLNSQCTDDNLTKRSRTSSISSLSNSGTTGIPTSVRNAITSSYSSTRGLVKTLKRGQSTSPLSSPPLSRSQTPERPAKKNREDASHQHSNASTPKSDGKEQQKEPTLLVQKPNSLSLLTSPSSEGKRKRKMQLLALRRRDPLTMPPPPQLGYSITAEDLDAEKKAALQYINKALEEEPIETASVSATNPAPSKPLVSTAPLVSTSFIASPPDSKLLTTWGMVSSNLTQTTDALAQSTSATSATSQTTVSVPAVRSQPPVELTNPSPLMSILLNKSSEDSLSASQPTVGSTGTPTFKPIFGQLAKVDSPMSPVNTCTASSTGTTPSFKPIFGTLGTPVTMSADSGSPFSFGQGINTAAISAPVTTASSALFNELAKTDSGATESSTSGALSDSVTKPSFSFGFQAATNVPSSTITSTTGQPFQFSMAASNSTTSAAAGFGGSSIFQFSKQAASYVTVSTASVPPLLSTFGQTASGSTPASSGFVFGSTPATQPTTAGTSQPSMTFGSSASFFSGPSSFSMNTNPPPYTSGQTAQPSETKPAVMNFGGTPSPFNFGSSSQLSAQPTFASAAQPPFGASSQTPFGTAGSNQPAFGSTKPVVSLGPTTTAPVSAFGSGIAQTTSVSMFGSAAPSQFGFGVPTQPGNSSSPFGMGVQGSSATPALSGFSFGSGQSAATTSAPAFGSSAMTQNVMSTPNQNASFAFGAANTSENRLTFGGSSTPTFGQSSTAAGSNLSFCTPTTPAMGFSTPGPSFGSPAPAFSIGAGSKPSGARQRLQARRQHTRKK